MEASVSYRNQLIHMNINHIGGHYHHEWYVNGDRICMALDTSLLDMDLSKRTTILDSIYKQIK